MISESVLSPRRLPDFTKEQQTFVLQQLALNVAYQEICELFLQSYPNFAENTPVGMIEARLYDRIRKLKSAKSDEIAKIASEYAAQNAPIRSRDADYRFRMLDEMLHNTPDTEVIYKTPEGVEKTQCNRSVKLKIIELMERIEGTFDENHTGYSPDEIPRLVPNPFPGKFEAIDEKNRKIMQLNPPPDAAEKK